MLEESLDTRRFQFRIVDLLLVPVVVALAAAAAKTGQINGTASSPVVLVVLAGILGAVTGRLVSGAFRFGSVAGVLLGVIGYLLAVFASSLGIRIADNTLFLVCVCTGGVLGGLVPTVLHRYRQASWRSRIGLLSVGFGLLAVCAFRWQTVREQADAVAALRAVGAYVSYDDVTPLPTIFNSQRRVGSHQLHSYSVWVRRLLGLRVIRSVTLTEKVDHRYAIQLLIDKLPWLQDLRLHAAQLDDEVFELLNSGKLSRLDHLRFTGREFDDASLSRLQPLPGLVLLDLVGTSVTDQSAEYIASFPQLAFIDISETDFTAAGAKRLQANVGRVRYPN